jgi:GTPase
MMPIVAIVGRPNVGKSTLFNRLVGKKLAIVHDSPGVTRDRHYADAYLQGRELTLVDTGGFDPNDEDPMRQGIARHVQAAIEEADVIVCALDALMPPTEADRAAIRILRQSTKPVVYFANRADNAELDLEANDLHRLGISPLIVGSALHGRGMASLEAAILDGLPKYEPEPEVEESDIPRVALLGRPNAGKSSLLNHLSGSERSLVDDRPGTTRDPVDARINYGGKNYDVLDTAGIRRKAKIEEAIELASVMRSIRALDRCDVVVLMCDGVEPISEQDAKILSLAIERGRAVIVGLNKMDLLKKSDQQAVLKSAREILHYAPWVPMVQLSAKTGRGVADLLKVVDSSFLQFSKRIGTSELNRFFEEVLDRRAPPTKGGRAPRLYYVTQVTTRPPVFIAMCSHPEQIDESYRRFVVNQLRAAFGYEAIPITLRFRARKRKEQ